MPPRAEVLRRCSYLPCHLSALLDRTHAPCALYAAVRLLSALECSSLPLFCRRLCSTDSPSPLRACRSHLWRLHLRVPAAECTGTGRAPLLRQRRVLPLAGRAAHRPASAAAPLHGRTAHLPARDVWLDGSRCSRDGAEIEPTCPARDVWLDGSRCSRDGAEIEPACPARDVWLRRARKRAHTSSSAARGDTRDASTTCPRGLGCRRQHVLCPLSPRAPRPRVRRALWPVDRRRPEVRDPAEI